MDKPEPVRLRTSAALLCGLLLAACTATDSPEACRLTHVADVPLRMVNGLPVVTVEVDGKRLRLVLDTGADGVVITAGAADRLGLARDYGRPGYVTGLGAQAGYWPTKPVVLRLGSVSTDPKALAIATIFGDRGGNAPDGLLGGEVLSAYDLDIDLAQRRLSLYRRRQCPGGPPPFPGPSVSLPAGRVGALRVTVPVVLDGRALAMMVDTGANRSMVDAAAAGVSEADLRADRALQVSTVDPVGLGVRLHAFKALRLGGDVVENPMLGVGRMETPGYGGLLGTDYWRSHRLWLSYGSGTVHIGPASPSPRSSPAS